MIHQNCKFLKIPFLYFQTSVAVREGGSCYSAQYEPLGNAKWNNLGLARLAANPYLGGNLILLLVPPAGFGFFFLFPSASNIYTE